MSETDVSICAKAMTRLGVEPITSFEDGTVEADALAFQAKMDAAKGYPNAATKTERYCIATKHPSKKQWVCPVDAPEEAELSEAESAALKTPADVAAFFVMEKA